MDDKEKAEPTNKECYLDIIKQMNKILQDYNEQFKAIEDVLRLLDTRISRIEETLF